MEQSRAGGGQWAAHVTAGLGGSPGHTNGLWRFALEMAAGIGTSCLQPGQRMTIEQPLLVAFLCSFHTLYISSPSEHPHGKAPHGPQENCSLLEDDAKCRKRGRATQAERAVMHLMKVRQEALLYSREQLTELTAPSTLANERACQLLISH